ncbi:neuronal acetylcholine receptor subunit alpha-10-like [Anneissia japonica]|uniref:neuronal acetylcholine receptor subunit alpha-10-like n=1 Tax=Anneissia japonica TaxID=1529436 RepID=UPI001425AD01|nr:neuronal acetylcholine receptor subunit alpha-10-like [Anneissia japonica]
MMYRRRRGINALFKGLFVLLVLLLTKGASTRSNESLLVEELLGQYGPSSSRPVRFQESVCRVSMRFIVTQVISLDERDQQMTVSGWLKYKWVDEYLQWNSSETNVYQIRVDVNRIWRPDIILYNDVDGKLKNKKTDLFATVYPDGVVEWSSPAIFISSCKMDVQYFPFDTQSCLLEFGSWAYEGHEVQLDLMQGSESSLTDFTENGIWELKEVTADAVLRTTSATYDYATIKMYLILKRRYEFYVSNIILPCVLLSFMSTLVYLMPPDCGEKISYGMTIVLSLLVLQQLISESLPPVAEGSPILGYYFTFVITMGCVAMLVTSIVLNIFCSKNVNPPPRWVESFFLIKLGHYIGRYRQDKESYQNVVTQQLSTNTDYYLQENGKHSIAETEIDSKCEIATVELKLKDETNGPNEALLTSEGCGPDKSQQESVYRHTNKVTKIAICSIVTQILKMTQVALHTKDQSLIPKGYHSNNE